MEFNLGKYYLRLKRFRPFYAPNEVTVILGEDEQEYVIPISDALKLEKKLEKEVEIFLKENNFSKRNIIRRD